MTPTWTDYLDAVEEAARQVQASLIEGRAPDMPVLEQPAGPPPAGAQVRREQVAALVAEVTELLGRHRDAITDRLASLPTQQRGFAGYELAHAGQALDMVG
jgi:hypothetical protein